MKNIPTLLSLLIIAVLTLLICSCNNPSDKRYPVKGIDVSHHQGDIIWDSIINQQITFAFLKATEGENHKDTRFEEYWAAISKSSIKKGAYHFFSFCKEGAVQAKNYIESVTLTHGDLPPAVDLEFAGNCKNAFDTPKLVAEIRIYLDSIEGHYGVKPVIYTTNRFYKEIIFEHFKDQNIWIRNTYFNPSLSNRKNWIFWQYKVGPFPGITGDVDLNVFNGSLDKLNTYCIP
ncbi:MAG: GH25 family lysozyme [Fibrobacterales bacterium]